MKWLVLFIFLKHAQSVDNNIRTNNIIVAKKANSTRDLLQNIQYKPNFDETTVLLNILDVPNVSNVKLAAFVKPAGIIIPEAMMQPSFWQHTTYANSYYRPVPI